MKIKLTQPKSGLIHFTQWKRKGFSLFQVVGKVVKVGVLAIAYLVAAEPAEAQKELRKTQAVGEVDVNLEEVEVKGQRISTNLTETARLVTLITKKEIARSPYSSILELLDQELSLDIRQRGSYGIQSDISMKGSTFEQVLILLNGIPLNDPQTGHFNGDIPVPLQAVERIEIIEGGASRWLGPNAFAGAINIITRSPEKKEYAIQLLGGQYQLFGGSATANLSKNSWSHLVSGSGLQTDGFRENTDLNSVKAYYSGDYEKNQKKFRTQVALENKKFGAQAFYTPVYPNQYEKVRSALVSVGWEKKAVINWSQDFYLKYHQDEFHLFRYQGPAWYTGPNQHLTRVFGLINTVWWKTNWGLSSLGLDYRNEAIWSSVLGLPLAEKRSIPGKRDAYYDHYADRQSLSLYGEQNWSHDRLSLIAGLMGQLFLGDSARFSLFPGLDLRYRLSTGSQLYLSLNRSLRNPTFTELYYKSATNQGNPNLLPEKAWSTQLGWKRTTGSTTVRASVYGSVSSNNIDWSKAPGEELWISRNITELTQLGAEIQAAYQTNGEGMFKNLKITAGYRYGYIYEAAGELDSRYVLDYLIHKALVQIQLPAGKNLDFTLMTNMQDRAGTFTDWDPEGNAFQREYDPFCLVDFRIRYRYQTAQLFMDLNNLFNVSYADIAQVWQPGFWLRFGAEMTFSR